MVVFSSNDFFNPHFSLIEWMKLKLLCHKERSWHLVQYWMYYRSSENMTKSAGSKTYSHSNFWLNVPWSFSCLVLLTVIPKLLVVLWLNSNLFSFLFLQHSPHVLDGVQDMTLGKPFQSLNSSLIQPFPHHFRCVFEIIVLLEHPTEPKSQSSG